MDRTKFKPTKDLSKLDGSVSFYTKWVIRWLCNKRGQNTLEDLLGLTDEHTFIDYYYTMLSNEAKDKLAWHFAFAYYRSLGKDVDDYLDMPDFNQVDYEILAEFIKWAAENYKE